MPPWNIAEQDENIPERIIKSSPAIKTNRIVLECVVQNSIAFSVIVLVLWAAFFVALAAVSFAVPLPAFAAAYSFLIACFCFHREMGLEAASGLSFLNFSYRAFTFALSDFSTSFSALS